MNGVNVISGTPDFLLDVIPVAVIIVMIIVFAVTRYRYKNREKELIQKKEAFADADIRSDYSSGKDIS